MFLTFEGIDGSGKSTQLRLLAEFLTARGIEVVQTREPGGTSLAEMVREFLLHGRDMLDARAELLLFGASRAQHVAEVVRPALESGKWVLCDRYGDSSEAYQGQGLGLDPAFIRAMNAFATNSLPPDKTFWLDVAPEVGFERRKSAGNDRIEARGLEFQARVRDAYRQIASREASRFAVIDGAQDVQAIHSQIVGSLGLS